MSDIVAAISPDIFTPWADRDLTFDLQPDDGLQVYRDGNKQLRLADPVGGIAAAQKYRLVISGEDLSGFAFGGVWVGTQFTVDLGAPIVHSLASGTNSIDVGRTIVPSSTVRAMTKDGADLTVSSVVGSVITVASHTGQAAFVAYQARLTMLLSDPWSLRSQVRQVISGNSLVLREV